ncbi:2-hydroxycarboxylate transporter family protein [Nocardiopsis sp. RSe5-2]|uniref:2-hydroxycarboxylate transporter family protein n=1 Tax=Nocardiopsis endophytica TaxID=3018445 RepID=A0ABT4TZ37_9ACTN|nr:2-hydroxycarboxylate transporter family protein [Nocardiopsis endophytica]MDA2809964.1 2-hydroxycarboxylate transporter family protein [Nocardiopsis endophytica]
MSSENAVTDTAEADGGPGRRTVRIFGFNAAVYAVLVAVVLAAVYLDALPDNIVSGMVIAVVLGGALKWAGDRIPVFNTFGGGPLLCIVVPAVLLYLNVLPDSARRLTDDFYTEFGFAEFAVTGIIVGSVLGIDRRLLIRIGSRFLVPLVFAVLMATGAGALVGYLTGFGAAEALLYVVAPTMGGGMAAGAIPMSEIYAAAGTGDAGSYLARLTPAVMLANILCILFAGVLNGLGKRDRFASLSGDGAMLRDRAAGAPASRPSSAVSLEMLATGMVLSITVYAFGELAALAVPGVHAYVWIIAAAAALKVFRVLPERVNAGAEGWYAFIAQAWVPAILVAISAGVIDLDQVLDVVSDPSYLALTVATVAVGAVAAGLAGLVIGFYFIESSIAAGLGMADMGGSGDVAVLSAGNRLGLMPFLQIASRIGGAGMLLVTSLAAPLLL